MTKEHYNAEDGLNVLNYLGLTRFTNKEIEVFKEKWNELYKSTNQDLIDTVWKLYAEVLPFMCGDGDRGSFMVAQLRDPYFVKTLQKTT